VLETAATTDATQTDVVLAGFSHPATWRQPFSAPEIIVERGLHHTISLEGHALAPLQEDYALFFALVSQATREHKATLRRNSAVKIGVHCYDGLGRTGTFLAAAALLSYMQVYVDRPTASARLRRARRDTRLAEIQATRTQVMKVPRPVAHAVLRVRGADRAFGPSIQNKAQVLSLVKLYESM